MQEKILRLFKNPKHVGKITKADGVGTSGDIANGDEIKLYIKVTDEVIVDAKFQAFGGPVTIALLTVMCDIIIGKDISWVKNINASELLKEIPEISDDKAYAATLCAEAIKDTIANYYKNEEKKARKESN